MVTLHISDLLSYFLSLQPRTDYEYAVHGPVMPNELKENIIAFGTRDKIQDAGTGSLNLLPYNGGGEYLSSFWARGRGKFVQPVSGSNERNEVPLERGETATEELAVEKGLQEAN